MPRNGAGAFSRTYDWTEDRDANVNITASRMDTEMDDLAAEITNSVAVDGQSTMTSNLKMGGNKVTGLGVGTATTDAATMAQVQAQTASYAADGGSANTYTITLSPTLAAYVTGQTFRFKAANACTGASTLNVDSLGAKNIKKNTTEDLASGDIVAGQVVEVTYDGTSFQITGLSASVLQSVLNAQVFS